jgi:N6-L-threonylcarbamoyladenine synthase
MQNPRFFILAIESSCDDTAAAVLHNDKVLSNVVANQKFIPIWRCSRISSRAHQQNIYRYRAALQNTDKEQLSAIAFTKVRD